MPALRRHYRRLLLPPGWVALGFLLLLGCQLLILDRRLQPETVVQLTLPILESQAKKQPNGSTDDYCFCKPLTLIKPATHWQNAQIIGNALAAPANKAALEAAVRAIQADEGHAQGVRIYFHRTATYGSLVGLLDMMNRLNQKKYWLDIEHQPTTFYAVNDRAVKIKRIPEEAAY